jgi:hypothetical protein
MIVRVGGKSHSLTLTLVLAESATELESVLTTRGITDIYVVMSVN